MTQSLLSDKTQQFITAINNMLKEDDKSVIKSLKELAKLQNEQEPTESFNTLLAYNLKMDYDACKAWDALPQWTRSRIQFFYSAHPETKDTLVDVLAWIGETIESEEENAA